MGVVIQIRHWLAIYTLDLTMPSSTPNGAKLHDSVYYLVVNTMSGSARRQYASLPQIDGPLAFSGAGATMSASSATRGTVRYDDGRPSVNVELQRQADGSYRFVP